MLRRKLLPSPVLPCRGGPMFVVFIAEKKATDAKKKKKKKGRAHQLMQAFVPVLFKPHGWLLLSRD